MARPKKAPANPTQTTLPEESKIISQIIRLATNRSYADIDTWKAAVSAAESPILPQRTQLYDLYYALNLDAQIRMIRKQLRLMVTGAPFHIIDSKTHEIDEELTKVFEKSWFRLIRENMIENILSGYRLLQITKADPTTGTIELYAVPPKHVHPEKGEWSKWQYELNGIPYRNDPKAMQWLIEIGDPYDLGELNACAPYILFKKNALQCWSAFAERFGMPLAKAKVNARDLKAVNRMESFLMNMGSNSYAIIDQAEEIDFVESVKSDAYDVYDKLIERCNSEMSKMILLQVMANDVGKNGSHAQSKTHSERMDEVKAELQAHVEEFVNESLLQLLSIHGFATEGKEGKYARQVNITKDENEKDQWLESNFEIDPEFWAEKYNVPITGRKAQPIPPTPAVVKPDDANPPTDPPTKEDDVEEADDAPTGDFRSIVMMHEVLGKLYAPHTH